VNQRPTIAEIAAEAGVSVPTVSKVLNQRTDVAEVTRQRVEAVIQKRGYVRNRAARALGGGQNGLVDLVIPWSLDSEYYQEILYGIEDVLSQAGKDMVLFTMYHEPQRQEELLARVSDRSTDGAIFLFPNSQAHIKELQRRHLPCVVIGESLSMLSHVPTVRNTSWIGDVMATEYLMSLGHRRIATMLCGPADHLITRARLAGYRAALEGAGLPIDPSLIREADFLPESGYAQTHALLALPDPPTAIFASCDSQAAGIYRALYEQEKRIPRDISVIGFDDIPSSAWTSPPLTTVRQQLKEMGRLGATMLVRLMAGETLDTACVELAPSLVIRDSCAPPPMHDR